MKGLITNQAILVTEYGAKIQRRLSIEEWTDALRDVRRIKHAYHAILSDLTSYGRKTFGDAVVAATLEQLEFEFTDANKATAIAMIPLEVRTRYKLNSEHALELSRLADEDEREKWAKICEKEKLSPLELKRSIETGRVLRMKEITEISGQNTGFPTIQSVRFSFERWERHMGERADVLSLHLDERRRILGLLEPIISLAADIEHSIPKA